MDENYIISVNSMLSYYLPIELNQIIINYVIVKHTFKLLDYVETVYETHRKMCVDGEYMYTYFKSKLISTKVEKYMTVFSCSSMCVYNNNIYVADNKNVHVFNKKCELVHTFACNSPKSNPYIKMTIIANRIYYNYTDAYTNRYTISIYDLHGTFISQIFLDSGLYLLKSYGENVYAMLLMEKIIKYSLDGIVVEEYSLRNRDSNLRNKDSNIFYDFFVIDTTIYVCFSNVVGIFKYTDKKSIHVKDKYKIQECKNEHIDNIKFVDNILYVYTEDESMYIYEVSEQNLLKFLTNHNKYE